MGLGFSVLDPSWGSGVLGLAVLRAGELFIAITAVIADYCGVSSVFLGLTIAAGINGCYWHYTNLIVMIGIVFGCCWY